MTKIFGSIKFKIFTTLLLMYIALILVVSGLIFLFYKESEDSIIDSYFHSITVTVQDINKKVVMLEGSSNNLANFGDVYFQNKPSKSVMRAYVQKVLEDDKEALGGGIWFKPNTFDKNNKSSCLYMYKNANNEIVEDAEFASEEYDYINQKWFKEISEGVSPTYNTVWSTPYYEKIGGKTFMVTAGSGIYQNGKLVGISTVDWKLEDIVNAITKIKPTPNSFSLFADKKNDFIIASNDYYLNNALMVGKSLHSIPWYNENLKQIRYYKYNGGIFIPYVKYLDNGMLVVVNVPRSEIFGVIDNHTRYLFFVLLLFSIVLTLSIYIVLQRNIIKPIDKLSLMANKISKGENDIHLKLEKPLEFSHLATTFDKMTHEIKKITKKQAKLDLELSVAKSIQASSLPNVFPPFPDRDEFDIYASMSPARDVGGDFYDFYFTSPKTLMFLIADVSGKGVPAALFMMKVKAIIANLAQAINSPEELISKINEEICLDNKEGFFVTMFSGILNTDTGELICINCGHNLPLLFKNDSEYKYMDCLEHNIALGAFDKFQFNMTTIQMNPGDKIFIYTDGITEAVNTSQEMYGEERLLECINKNKQKNIYDTLRYIKNDVAEYSKNTEQSDDITMLMIQYNGADNLNDNKKIFKEKAKQENYKKFYTWLHKNCEEWNLNEDLKSRLDMCAEEIFANIIFYAYPDIEGVIVVSIENINNEIILKFVDDGIEYNPLAKADPDINLPPEERPLGGLGIFMVKQIAVRTDYERKGGKNIFTIALK